MESKQAGDLVGRRADDGGGSSRFTTSIAKSSPVIALVIVLIAGSPLAYLSARADERFKHFLHGPDWAADPFSMVAFVASEIDGYIGLGNFRPLGRIIEHTNFLVADQFMLVTGAPLNAAIGFIRLSSLVLLCMALAAVVFQVGRLYGASSSWRRIAATLGVALVGVLATSYGTGSGLITFSGLYIQSATLTLLMVLPFLRRSIGLSRRVRLWEYAGYFALGIIVASTNEILYVAALIGTVVVVARAPVRDIASFVRSAPAPRLLAISGTGFLAVFLPTRILIALACSGSDADCYRASSIDLSGWSLGFWLERVGASVPIQTWRARDLPEDIAVAAILFGLLCAALLAALLIANLTRAPKVSEEPLEAAAPAPIIPTPWLLLVLLGATVVLSTALLSSLSAGLQASQSSYGWREAPLAIAGWAIIGCGLASFLVEKAPWKRVVAVIGSLVIGVAITLTVGANFTARSAELNVPIYAAGDRIALEVAAFDSSETGDERRCAAEAWHAEAYAELPGQHERIMASVDRYTTLRYGTEFCEGAVASP